MDVMIDSAFEGYLFLLLDMWPVLIIAFVGLALSFYGVLMKKAAIFCVVIAIAFGILGGVSGY